MYWESTKFYKEFAGKKCKYWTYLTRLWKGMDMKQAIQPRDLHFKWRIDAFGKTCPRCMKYKLTQWYYNSKAEKSWKDSCCMDCRKQQRKDDRWDDVKLARERKYRKGYQIRPEVVKRMALDSLFYSLCFLCRDSRCHHLWVLCDKIPHPISRLNSIDRGLRVLMGHLRIRNPGHTPVVSPLQAHHLSPRTQISAPRPYYPILREHKWRTYSGLALSNDSLLSHIALLPSNYPYMSNVGVSYR